VLATILAAVDLGEASSGFVVREDELLPARAEVMDVDDSVVCVCDALASTLSIGQCHLTGSSAIVVVSASSRTGLVCFDVDSHRACGLEDVASHTCDMVSKASGTEGHGHVTRIVVDVDDDRYSRHVRLSLRVEV
jgi:hypothetical protein